MIDSEQLLSHDSSTRPPLVLIAEDDNTSVEMLQTMLGRVGFETRIARDGNEALERLEEKPVPDLVLLDWMMPGRSGVEVCREIRATHDPLDLPIIMVTAKADAESVTEAFEAGASDYITKPFLGAELRSRLASHLRLKRLSEERRAMDEHLMEREKLSTLGLLVSGVAHELNNPLGGIYGYAQLLLEGENTPDRLVALERIVSEVQRCNRIVGDLLSFSRRHKPERSKVDVGEILMQTLSLRERPMESQGVWARLSVEPGLPLMVGDPHQLLQVFVNILVNAEHALAESGSKLQITAERASGNEDPGEFLAIRIFNDGPPIPESARERIFDPFYTTKGKDEGTGLGLAICQRIVREHGGEIEVESDDGGTTFHILLPVASASELAAAASDETDREG